MPFTESEVEIERKGWASIEGKGVLTESEWRRIDEIYENHRTLLPKLLDEIEHEVDRKYLWKALILPLLPFVLKSAKSETEKRLKEAGFEVNAQYKKILDLVGVCYTLKKSSVYDDDWHIEAFFTKTHLKYLPMKSNIDEDVFENFLHFSILPIQLRKNEKDELLEIFKRIKRRVEKMKISDECKADLTPWEFFRNHFFKWQREEQGFYSSDSERRIQGNYAYYVAFNIFKEFDEAPRISGDLVVELEDFLDEKKYKDIIPVSKDEVMKLVEAWRKYKVEARL